MPHKEAISPNVIVGVDRMIFSILAQLFVAVFVVVFVVVPPFRFVVVLELEPFVGRK